MIKCIYNIFQTTYYFYYVLTIFINYDLNNDNVSIN